MHNQHIAPLQTPQHLKQKSGGGGGREGEEEVCLGVLENPLSPCFDGFGIAW